MRYIIYITIAFLSVFCFSNAMAQVSVFGTNNVNGFSKTVGTLWLSKYADGDSIGNVLAVDVEGKVYKTNGGTTIDTTRYILYTDTSRSGIVTTYFYVDSLYNSIGTHDSLVKYSDSLTGVYATGYGVDTAKSNLRTSIATKLNSADTASLSTRINTKLTKGGDATGATLVAGTNDANRFDLEANNATGITLHNGGDVSVGSTIDDGTKFKVTGTVAATGRTNIGSLALGTKSPMLTVSGASASNNTSNVATYGAIAVVADIAPAGGEGGGVYFGSRQGLQALIRSSLTSGAGNTTGDLIFSTRNATGDVSFTDRLRINNTGQIWQGNPATAVRLLSNFTTEASANFGATGIYTISDFGNIGSNYYYNGTNFLAKTGVMSAQIDWTSGNHDFKIAAIVPANNTITWTTAMRILNTSGFVGLNRDTPTERLHVNGKVRVENFEHRSTIGDSLIGRRNGVLVSRLPENYYTGWAQYTDTGYKVSSPFTIASGTTDTLENRAQLIINHQKPIDAVGELYNSATKKIVPIDTFDGYVVEFRFTAVSTANFDNFRFGIDIGGTFDEIAPTTLTFQKNAGNPQDFKVTYFYFTGPTFIANNGTVKITTTAGDVSFYNINYLISRTHKAR